MLPPAGRQLTLIGYQRRIGKIGRILEVGQATGFLEDLKGLDNSEGGR